MGNPIGIDRNHEVPLWKTAADPNRWRAKVGEGTRGEGTNPARNAISVRKSQDLRRF
jgi:hypothetical protein